MKFHMTLLRSRESLTGMETQQWVHDLGTLQFYHYIHHPENAGLMICCVISFLKVQLGSWLDEALRKSLLSRGVIYFELIGIV